MDSTRRETCCCGSWVVREDWPLWLLLAASLVVGIVLYPALPDRIPLHWNIQGQIDRYGSKAEGVFGMLALNVGLYLFFLALPRFDPRRENYAKFAPTYRFFRSLFVVFMTVLWGVAMAAAKGMPVDTARVVPLMVSALFILIGNLMGRVRYNWFVGIRTPWSLANEEAWRLTHRAAGPAWVLGGLVSLAGAFFGKAVAAVTMGIGLGGATIFSVVYSYFAWRRTAGTGRK
ncbi:MAG: SdpI family protein [Betaproteobacteria bacterium]